MPRLLGKTGAVGLAYGAWKLWRRLPKEQRQMLLEQARKHGPTLAKTARKMRAR